MATGGVGDRPGAGQSAADDLLLDLTDAQRAAVVSPAAPLAIVAAAGAGKTRVLTRRIAYRCLTGTASAPHTLALTFTRKAAGELQQRLGQLGLRERVATGTFHAHAHAQLQRWWADRRQTPPVLLDRKSRVLGPIVEGRAGLDGVRLSEIAAVIEWAKARTVPPDDLPSALARAGRPIAGRASSRRAVDPEALAGVFHRYEHEKTKRGLIDFDDLLSACADAIERDPGFAAAQRWCWQHVYVDEFQDLNPLQHRLLLAWLGDRSDLCVVGDPNQAIYGWNGADPGLLDGFARQWPEGEVLRLDANHRSSAPIVRVAAAVLGDDGRQLTAGGREGVAPEVVMFASDHAEAGGIAAALSQAHAAGRPWSAMAVLTRTNAQLSVVEQALTLTGVPWWSAASAALLDQPEIRGVLPDLRRMAGRPLPAALADLAEMAAERDEATGGSLMDLVDTGRMLLTSRPESTVGDWLAWLPAGTRDRSDGRQGARNAVTLSSFHRAKGLEWALVWVAGIEEGLVPMGSARTEAAEREERRLLYVAMTRAVDDLRLSWAATRTFGGHAVDRRPSRWLEAVLDACAAEADHAERLGAERRAVDWRARLREQRLALREHSAPAPRRPAEEATRRALVAWRLEMARHSGVPPRVLLHDATLNAIAERPPATMDELLSMPGFGAVKAARYGPLILDLLAERRVSA